MLDQWKADLQQFTEVLGIRAPRIVVKRSRFEPIWCVTSWSAKPGAWAGLNTIVVSPQLLSCSPELRRYLLAHELGHIARRHSTRVILPLLVILLCVGVVSFHPLQPYLAPMPLRLFIAALFFSAAGYVLWFTRGFAPEYEADAVAARLIGKDAVILGYLRYGRAVRGQHDHQASQAPKEVTEDEVTLTVVSSFPPSLKAMKSDNSAK